ncbi:hypothetical protein CD31A_2250 [Corynebacterium diphtheriae 31A]|nr:hypothetical protein CD31A_2250 [Corynebacterium diphtheriae 31A]
MGHDLYVGLRFKNRAIYSSVADDYVEFFLLITMVRNCFHFRYRSN